MMKTKRDSKAAIVCIALLVSLFIFQFNISSILKMNPSHSALIQERKHVEVREINNVDPHSQPLDQPLPSRQIRCDRQHNSYDLCSINGPTVLDPTISTFFLMDPTKWTQPENIRPYPRKSENFTMGRIKEITITSGPSSPKCEIQHHSPALVFSAGGYTGNFFHDFNDGFIPLFITINSVFPLQQDIILVISKARDWWISKYSNILQMFSNHTIINLDKETVTHCFPNVRLGLISHGFMTIDPKLIPIKKTFTHFRAFLAKAYDQNPSPPVAYVFGSRPRLVLLIRSGGVGRVLLNQLEVKKEAEKVGFEVILFEPTSRTQLREAYALLNSSHAMVGVHGAALTHLLFLRRGSVLVQVVPLGTEWVAEVCFGKAAREMGLEYMEYRIRANESSLIEKYGKDEIMIKDPRTYMGKNWSNEIMNIYLKEQNVNLDLIRFRDYLKNAYWKAMEFMQIEG